MKKVNVVVGRFQTSRLTSGHEGVIYHASNDADVLVLVVGVHPIPGTRRNPLDFYSRARMLQAAYPHAVILPLEDVESDVTWSSNLDSLLEPFSINSKITLIGGRDSFIPRYRGKYNKHMLHTDDLLVDEEVSATSDRIRCSEEVINDELFRHGCIYSAYNRFPRVSPTVDVAMLRSMENGKYVLMGKKKYDTKWRFPGGFVDPTDTSLEAAAIRELQEETNLEGSFLKYEKSFKIEDWRTEADSTVMTTLFSCEYSFGSLAPGDDLVVLSFISLTMDNVQFVTESHREMFEYMRNKYNALR